MGRYRAIPHDVDAWQVTPETVLELAEMTGARAYMYDSFRGTVRSTHVYLEIHYPTITLRANEGDWVVRSVEPDQHWYVLPASVFDRQFEKTYERAEECQSSCALSRDTGLASIATCGGLCQRLRWYLLDSKSDSED